MVSADYGGTKPNTLQKPHWKESAVAIKTSVNFDDFSKFRAYMEENLPQNSDYARLRFMRSIIKRFFPERSLDVLPALVWKHYKDGVVLEDVMRYQFLHREPVVAEFVTKNLAPLHAGDSIEREVIKNFIISKYGKYDKDSAGSLSSTINDLGFVYRSGKQLTKKSIRAPKSAFLILTHYLFAQKPSTVKVRQIAADPYWEYLGINSINVLRKILLEAYEHNIIVKYTAIDELEQITTKYTFAEFLERKTQL